MKKIFIISTLAIAVATSANAGGLYLTPKVAFSHTDIKESRVEKAWNGSAWSEYANNKHESWSDNVNNFVPKIALGYDFDTEDLGIFSVEAEYGKTNNQFKAMNETYDFAGSTPNDSDMRTYEFSDATLALNAKYGYDFKIGENISATPYLTAGIGYSIINSESNFRSGTYWWNTKDQEENLSWNIGAGVEVPLTSNFSIIAEYKYTDLGKVKYSNWMYHEKGSANGIERHFDSEVELKRHEVLAGAKIKF